jgi:hypothetical protein
MSNINQRLAKVEQARQGSGVVVVWKNSDESVDSAMARWMTDRPGEPDARTAVYLISWQAAEGTAA